MGGYDLDAFTSNILVDIMCKIFVLSPQNETDSLIAFSKYNRVKLVECRPSY